jgi:hypothetical protein
MSTDEEKLAVIREQAALHTKKKLAVDRKQKEKIQKRKDKRVVIKVAIIFPFFAFGLYSLVTNVLLAPPLNLPSGNATYATPLPATIKWYEGGTLHDATVGEWATGSYQDQLATAGDWIVARLGSEQARKMTQLRNRAATLVSCVNSGSVAVMDSYGNSERVAGMAVACIDISGWR